VTKVTLVVTDATAKALASLCGKGFLRGFTKGKDDAWLLAGLARSVDGTRSGARPIMIEGNVHYVPRRRTHYSR
jgi:hypothetical protein